MTYIVTSIIMYFIARLILTIYNERATQKQQWIFAIVSSFTYHTWIYGAFLLGGMISFTPLQYRIIVYASPFLALVYYLACIWALRLPKIRAIRPVCHIFIYFSLISHVNLFLGSLFFTQDPVHYNYFFDALQQISHIMLNLFAYLVLKSILNRNKSTIMLSDKMFINVKWEWTTFMIKTTTVYLIPVIIPFFISNHVINNFFNFMFVYLVFMWNFSNDVSLSRKQEIASRDAHITALTSSIGEFRRLKHDFFNILQTYGGFLDVGNWDGLKAYHKSLVHITTDVSTAFELSQHLSENPPFVSLLINKSKYADQLGVDMKVSLLTSLDEMHIESLDLCRALACLLDNAIEAAAESEKKRVFFGLEKKASNSKMIIITNSTSLLLNENSPINSGVSTKAGHQGIGISTARKTFSKYPNCRFHYAYYPCEVSAYIEIK